MEAELDAVFVAWTLTIVVVVLVFVVFGVLALWRQQQKQREVKMHRPEMEVVFMRVEDAKSLRSQLHKEVRARKKREATCDCGECPPVGKPKLNGFLAE